MCFKAALHPSPITRGNQSAKSGTAMTATAESNMASTSQITQGTVLSMETPAIRQDTIKFTAMGGVNCPIAIIIVSTTPNQVKSH